ncbi:MAG: tetratricopeptide repeat protein [Deltaproteobacteria bacterium]|nr:tetratricopeptide repeat protein [Deltaproteobacteria bacterium]
MRIGYRSFVNCMFLFFLFISTANASMVTFVKEYTYQASEIDSKVSCRANAMEQVKRLLLEELGTYLESKTEVKNFQLTQDQITVLTAGIVSAEIVREKWDGDSYFLKAKITADPNEVALSVDKLRKDNDKVNDLNETRKLANKYAEEIKLLKKELESVHSIKTDQRTESTKIKDYNKAIDGLTASDLYAKGYSLYTAKKYNGAIAKFGEAIRLKPDYDQAYRDRGLMYSLVNNHRQAIENYNKAIEINPADASSYNMRGRSYRSLGDNHKAIEDFDKAIKLKPNFGAAYYNRGLTYDKIGNEQKAIEDMKRSAALGSGPPIQYLKKRGITNWQSAADQSTETTKNSIPNNDALTASDYYNNGKSLFSAKKYAEAIVQFSEAIRKKPDYDQAYRDRGLMYSLVHNYQKAIEDYNKAIEINPADVLSYNSRGISYRTLGDSILAIENFDRAIELKPNFGAAYFNRALAYEQLSKKQDKLRNEQQAIEDMKSSAKLGFGTAKYYLKKAGIDWQ